MVVAVHQSMIAEVAAAILGGGVVLAPTDTVYGLAVHPGVEHAVDRVFAMKGRPLEKNLPVMVCDPEKIGLLGVELNRPARRLLESGLIPGPVTLALGFDQGAQRPEWLAGRVEVAVRVPNHEVFRAVLRQTGPLLVTSANVSGQPTHEEPEAIMSSLRGAPDYVINGGRLSATPSTLVNCRVDPPVIERVGAVPARLVGEILGG